MKSMGSIKGDIWIWIKLVYWESEWGLYGPKEPGDKLYVSYFDRPKNHPNRRIETNAHFTVELHRFDWANITASI